MIVHCTCTWYGAQYVYIECTLREQGIHTCTVRLTERELLKHACETDHYMANT